MNATSTKLMSLCTKDLIATYTLYNSETDYNRVRYEDIGMLVFIMAALVYF